MNASEEVLVQRDDDARRAAHAAESVLILVLGHLADQFGAVGAQASGGVVYAFDCKHDAPAAQRVFGLVIAGWISTSFGLRNFVSSSSPCPPWVRTITMSTCILSSPLTRFTHEPSTASRFRFVTLND